VTLGRRLQGLLRRTGTRLALIQAAVVVAAFALAGYASQVAIDRINRDQVRREVSGEMDSMNDEFRTGGADHVAKVVVKRSRLWRGFDYRFVAADGQAGGGRLPAGEPLGWAMAHPDPRDPHWSGQGVVVLTARLPDGSQVSVGKDLGADRDEAAALTRALALSGLLGVGFCLVASYLFSRGAWRRIDDLAAAAKAVADGRLTVRARTQAASAPRDDLGELAGAFNAMLDRLEELIAQVRQVSSDIAHDLRTPLTRVRQRLERLREEAGDAGREADIARIEADLDAVLAMFAALLRLAEIESDPARRREAPVDLADIAQRMADAYRPDIEASGRRLLLDVAPAVVSADDALIAQAVANLLDNALRHTQVAATISIEAGVRDGAPLLAVSDDGPGIPAALREAALQRSRRLDPGRSGGGFGLGLAIVAAIARRHRARLALSDAGPGLRVALVFGAEA
jgi:hypothetical protein